MAKEQKPKSAATSDTATSEKVRKGGIMRKGAASPEVRESVRAARRDEQVNPSWFVPVMIGFFVVGFLWIMVYYISMMQYPIPGIGWYNVLIGFGLMLIGLIMTTRWK